MGRGRVSSGEMTNDEYGQLIEFLGQKFGEVDRRFGEVDRQFVEVRADVKALIR